MSIPSPSRGPTPARAGHPAGAPRPRPTRRLALVPPVRAAAPRAPFVVLVVSLLVAGLAALLFLHTALAEDSFRLHDLQSRSGQLEDQEQALEQTLALAASPARLADKAHALGMVRSENPAFIRLSDGRILGRPKAGVAPPPPPVATPDPSSSASEDAAGTKKQSKTQAKKQDKKQRRKAGNDPATPSPGTGR